MEPESMLIMVMPQVVKKVDQAIDDRLPDNYDSPIAKDWARVGKLSEEVGEAVTELLLWSGAFPRKAPGGDPAARVRMIAELADVAMAAIYAVQHFTKDLAETQAFMIGSQKKAFARLVEKEGEHGATVQLPSAIA